MSSSEAETRAREFIKQKHARLERVFFPTIYREQDFWVLKGEVEFRQACFFTSMKFFEAKINMNTGVVAFYKETYLRNSKEQQGKQQPISLNEAV